MGFYINPTDCSKEEWLQKHGISGYNLGTREGVDLAVEAGHQPPEYYPVCLVDNGWMKAAGIAYNLEEHRVFADTEHDKRPRKWFVVSREKLIEVCPEVAGALS